MGVRSSDAGRPDYHIEGVGWSPALPPPLEDLAAPVWLLDPKGEVLGANRNARQLESSAGCALPLTTPGCRDILGDRSELRRAVECGRPLEVCVRGLDQRCLRMLVEPMRDANGTPAGALLVATGANQEGSSRSLFLRTLRAVSHELHAPLTPLVVLARLSQRAAATGETNRVSLYLERLHCHARQIEHLLTEISDLADVLAGGLRLQPESFDLADLVRECVDAAAAEARDHVFQICAPTHAVVVADRERLARVVRALLSNAVRFSGSSGRVEAVVSVSGPMIELAVSDSGTGLAEERLDDLFDGPGWDEGTPPGGLGLGLYLAREVIERHGGRIGAERDPRGGTCFRVTLPRLNRG